MLAQLQLTLGAALGYNKEHNSVKKGKERYVNYSRYCFCRFNGVFTLP